MNVASYTHRHKLLMALLGAGSLVVVGGIVGVVMLLSGAMNTAATNQHFYLTHRVLEEGLRYSVRTHSGDIVPPPLEGARRLETGLACYRQHCVQCHGAPGVAPGPASRGMLPIPSNLAQAGREWSPEWLYYVTSKGVRMTGMPAWEFRMSEDSLWSTVAFLRTLPFLTAAQYRERVAALTAACEPRTDLPDMPREKLADTLMRQYACHSCHLIDGVIGPRVLTGPPLRAWSRRSHIAGILPNTRENLIRWIQDPQAVSPDTLMPDLEVPELHAAVMADFLLEQE